MESVLAVHGGAGDTPRSALSPDQRRALEEGLVCALRAGRDVLAAGGSALDAVLAAVVALEDAEAFNAGRGSVLRDDGTVSMDASVMWGIDRSAGGVVGVRRVRNPVRAAELVRRSGRHVLLSWPGADALAEREGLALEPPEYFVTEPRRAQLLGARSRGAQELDVVGGGSGSTVGAVARDRAGHLAAATSTGGMTNSLVTRIGDSPLPGAGTWADDASCAVSATGQGEFFVRSAFAHEVDANVRLAGLSIVEACARALDRVREIGGRGGCVAVDRAGEVALPFYTQTMPRGQVVGEAEPRIALFSGDALHTFGERT